MKKTITLIMASVMLLCAKSAFAWDGAQGAPCFYEDSSCCEEGNNFYVGGFAGGNWIQTTKNRSHHSKAGYALLASVGYRWCDALRVEFEYGYRRNKHKNSSGRVGRNNRSNNHFWSSSYMANAIWDIDWCNEWCLKPFIGGGVGYSLQHGRSIGREGQNKRKGFAWQVLAGVAYPICDNTDMSLEYRFHKGKLNHLYNHSFGVGLKYFF